MFGVQTLLRLHEPKYIELWDSDDTMIAFWDIRLVRYVCLHVVCVCVYMCVHMLHMCMHDCVHMFWHVSVGGCTYVYVCLCVCVCVLFVSMHYIICVCVCVSQCV